ncbi:hypothetical protein D3C76_1222860 [compost metagenome]
MAGRGYQLLAVHAAGHADIADQQVDGRAVLQCMQGAVAVAEFDLGVTQVAEYLADQHADGCFIIDQHHRHVAQVTLLACNRQRLFGRQAGAVQAWQVQVHTGALARFRIHPHLATGLADETIDHRQPQARTLAHRLGGEERIEGARQHLRWHAAAVIADAQGQVVTGGQVQVRGDLVVSLQMTGFDGDPAAGRHGVTGVDTEVEQGVFQLR